LKLTGAVLGTIAHQLPCCGPRRSLPGLHLRGLDNDAQLLAKRDQLRGQLAVARRLEWDVQLLRQRVTSSLERYLSDDELADCRHFVHDKAKLIVGTRRSEK